MKRIFLVIISIVILLISGCSETAVSESGINDQSNLTLQQVLEKAIDRQQNLKSVHAKIAMNQSSEIIVQGQTLKSTAISNLNMDMNQSPLALYAEGSMGMIFNEETIEIPLEMYMTEQDGLYMLNSDSNQWIKPSAEEQEQFIKQSTAQANASDQLEQLKQFVDDFQFEQDDENYKLTLNINGDSFKEFVLSQIGLSLDDTAIINEEQFQSITFEDSIYVIYITKNTFDTKEIDMDITMSLEDEIQQMIMKNEANILYSNFNKVDTISIPKEVINKAVTQ